MNFNVNFIDELAAAEHRHDLEEQARVERLLAEAHAGEDAPLRHGLMWLLRWRRHERADERADDEAKG